MEGKASFVKLVRVPHGALYGDHRRRRRPSCSTRSPTRHDLGVSRHPRPQSDFVQLSDGVDPQRLHRAHRQQAAASSANSRSAFVGLPGDRRRGRRARRRAPTASTVIEVGPDQTREVRVAGDRTQAAGRGRHAHRSTFVITDHGDRATRRQRPTTSAARDEEATDEPALSNRPTRIDRPRCALSVCSAFSASCSRSTPCWSTPRCRPSAASRRQAPTRPASIRARSRGGERRTRCMAGVGKLARNSAGEAGARRDRARRARARRSPA